MKDSKKIKWRGEIISIQPRTTVWRYVIDNRTHSHIGYNLFVDGEADLECKTYSVAISEKQQQKHMFCIGDKVEGTAWTKINEVTDYADYYRAGGFKIIEHAEQLIKDVPPPYRMTPPDMATYEWRGARMLAKTCWKGKCFQCVWATMAAVEIEYNWGVSRKYRFESFCYGPKSCRFYKMGKPRAVPYKDRGTSYDEGWLDEIISENRGFDD